MNGSPSSECGAGPRRQSEGAFAILARVRGGTREWLTRWNRKWGCYFLIGGHREADETFAACVVRELEEELGVRRGVDYTLCETPMARAQYTAWSASAGAETEYTMEFFSLTPEGSRLPLVVQGPSRVGREASDSEEPLRWVTAAEIRAARTGDGEPISKTLASLFDAAGWPPQAGGGGV
jgi:8-oxo-dGTP pyrophosphatase MutT (NUDIX family)